MCIGEKGSKDQVLVGANLRRTNILKIASNCKRLGKLLNWVADLTSVKERGGKEEEGRVGRKENL